MATGVSTVATTPAKAPSSLPDVVTEGSGVKLEASSVPAAAPDIRFPASPPPTVASPVTAPNAPSHARSGGAPIPAAAGAKSSSPSSSGSSGQAAGAVSPSHALGSRISPLVEKFSPQVPHIDTEGGGIRRSGSAGAGASVAGGSTMSRTGGTTSTSSSVVGAGSRIGGPSVSEDGSEGNGGGAVVASSASTAVAATAARRPAAAAQAASQAGASKATGSGAAGGGASSTKIVPASRIGKSSTGQPCGNTAAGGAAVAAAAPGGACAGGSARKDTLLNSGTTTSTVPIRLAPIEHTMTGREFRTEATAQIKGFAKAKEAAGAAGGPAAATAGASSSIPEKDAVLWSIKDFSAFRNAAKVSKLPPLVSPEVGSGCRVRLSLFDRKGHISGVVELPLSKASRDGVAHFRVAVVRPDLKIIVLRKVEMRINASSNKKTVSRQAQSAPFRLTRPRCLRFPRFDHLLVGDVLRVRLEFEYFPFDAAVFRGFSAGIRQLDERCRLTAGPAAGGDGGAGEDAKAERGSGGSNELFQSCVTAGDVPSDLLSDIRTFCKEDTAQSVEIKRDNVVFQACRFLLCARSRRFRELFNSSIAAKSPGGRLRFLKSGAAGTGTAEHQAASLTLSSITVSDVSATALDMMLTYIHTDTCHWVADMSVDILKLLELFEAAYLYGVDALVRLLVRTFAARLDAHNFCFVYELSERCEVPELRRLCTDFMDSLPGSQVATLMRAATAPQGVSQ